MPESVGHSYQCCTESLIQAVYLGLSSIVYLMLVVQLSFPVHHGGVAIQTASEAGHGDFALLR